MSPCAADRRERPLRYGMPVEQWRAAAAELQTMLEDAAARRTTVTYGEAARRAFGGRFSARSRALMDLLGEVDEAMLAERGFMIAALVVRADTRRPGDGYFSFAEQHEGHSIPDREAYWLVQAELVWNRYSSGTSA